MVRVTRPSSPGWWPSYENLAGVIALTGGGGAPIDELSGAQGALSGSTKPTWDRPEPVDHQPTLLFTQGASLNSYADFGATSAFVNLGVNKPMTLIARVFWTGGKGGIAERLSATSGWVWGISSQNYPLFMKRQNGGDFQAKQAAGVFGEPAFAANQWCTLAVTYGGEIASNGGSITNYLNGRLLTNTDVRSGVGTNLSDEAGTFRLGNSSVDMPGLGNPTMAGSFGGNIAWLLAFDRVLSLAEIRQFNYEGGDGHFWSMFATPLIAQFSPAPPEIEFVDGGLVDVGLTWVEVTDKQNTKRVHSKVALPDPADYYGGFKDDRVISWGRVTRALSDRVGQYEAAQFNWLQADTDRLYRGIGDSVFTRVLKNRPATLRMIDDTSRRARLKPRTMMKGLIRGYKPEGQLQWQWTMRDILAARFSTESTKSQLPTRLIGRADFPDCPTDALNLPVPIIYGNLLDATSESDRPVVTGTAALGSFVQDGFRQAGFGPKNSAAAVPTGVTVGLASGGTLSVDVPNGEYAVLVTAVDAAGVESDPHVYYYDGPGVGRGSFGTGPLGAFTVTPDGTQKIQVAWSASAGAVTYRAYLAWYYYGARFTQFISTAGLSCEFTANPAWGDTVSPDNITPAAELVNFQQNWWWSVTAELPDGETAHSQVVFGTSKPYLRPVRIEWLPVTGALGYKVYRRGGAGTWDRSWVVSSSATYFDDDLLDTGVTHIDGTTAPTGQVPVIHVGMRADVDGFRWKAFLVAGHAVKEITDVFQGGERVPSGNFGVTWAVPGKPGYETYFPDTGADCQYLDVNGNRYTMLFVRGPDAERAVGGDISGGDGDHGDDTTIGGGDSGGSDETNDGKITVNVRGIETAGDSTGEVITDGLQQYLHAIKNWVLNVYLSGSWLAGPMFADDPTLPQIDEASFTAASAVAATRFTGGYTGAWMLGAGGERISVRDFVARMNIGFDVDSGFNRKTQFFVSMVDDSLAAVEAASKVVDVRDVHAGSFNADPVDSEQFNFIPYVYRRDYTGKRPTGWHATSEESDPESIEDLDETKPSTQIELHPVRSATQALDVIQRRLLRSKDPIRVTWTMGMAGLSIELGGIVKLTHYSGMGESGYVERPIRITRHETDPEKYTVTLEGWDMARLFEGTLVLGNTAVLPAAWTSATVAQRQYGYLCDETTGLFSDNSRGKRLR